MFTNFFPVLSSLLVTLLLRSLPASSSRAIRRFTDILIRVAVFLWHPVLWNGSRKPLRTSIPVALLMPGVDNKNQSKVETITPQTEGEGCAGLESLRFPGVEMT